MFSYISRVSIEVGSASIKSDLHKIEQYLKVYKVKVEHIVVDYLVMLKK